MPTLPITLKRSQSLASAPVMHFALPKSQCTIGEILGTAGSMAKKVEWKQKNQVVEPFDVTEPAATPELGTQVVKATRKVRTAMYSVC